MTRKKNGFWRFIFSLLPGAGEMYMGFMKMGVSLMGLFFVIIAVASYMDIGPIVFIALIAWFYSFFHVHNLAGLPDEEFYAVEDEYLFFAQDGMEKGKELVGAYRKIIAVILIVVGAVMTWKSLFRMLDEYLPSYICRLIDDLTYRIPQLVVGIAVIVLGVYMIHGKKKQLDTQETVDNEGGLPDGK